MVSVLPEVTCVMILLSLIMTVTGNCSVPTESSGHERIRYHVTKLVCSYLLSVCYYLGSVLCELYSHLAISDKQ